MQLSRVPHNLRFQHDQNKKRGEAWLVALKLPLIKVSGLVRGC